MRTISTVFDLETTGFWWLTLQICPKFNRAKPFLLLYFKKLHTKPSLWPETQLFCQAIKETWIQKWECFFKKQVHPVVIGSKKGGFVFLLPPQQTLIFWGAFDLHNKSIYTEPDIGKYKKKLRQHFCNFCLLVLLA